MSEIVRWGILGTSRHAAMSLIPAFDAAHNATVVAVGSRSATSAARYAGEYGIPTAYGRYEDLLADSSIDAVYIPLPNHLHRAWAIRAAEAGKHVLCEKPIGLNAAEAGDMVRVFRRAGLKLAEAFQWRHHPQAQRVRALVQEGVIGDLRLIDAGFSFMLNRPGDIRGIPETGGGSLYDVGCYPVALARYVTGQEPLSVTAQAHWNAAGIDDLVVATLAFPGDVLAHINCGFVLPLRRYYEVVGTDGSLAVNRAYNPKDDYPGQVVRRGADREVLETIDVGRVNSYTREVEDFSAAVLENRDPLFPAEDAIGNMRVIDAIYEAARTGGAVTVGG